MAKCGKPSPRSYRTTTGDRGRCRQWTCKPGWEAWEGVASTQASFAWRERGKNGPTTYYSRPRTKPESKLHLAGANLPKPALFLRCAACSTKKTSFANRAQRRELSRRPSRFLFSNLRFITRKSNVQPVFAGTSSPGRLENGVFLISCICKTYWFCKFTFVAAEVEICFS